MGIAPSWARLATSALRIARQGLELASIDFEEEALRLGLLLVAAIVTAFTTAIAILLLVGAIVIYFWDTARWTALLSLCAFFSCVAAVMAWKLNTAVREKPRFMAASLKVLRGDGATENGA